MTDVEDLSVAEAIAAWNDMPRCATCTMKEALCSCVVVEHVPCTHCGDTHTMQLEDSSVMCTWCPVPCQNCRAGGFGAYCAETPCLCDCHVVQEGVL
jgi:hypothetical protein